MDSLFYDFRLKIRNMSSTKEITLNQKAYILVVTLVLLSGITFMVSYLNMQIKAERWWFRSLIERAEVEAFFPEVMENLAGLIWLYQKRYGEVPTHLHFEVQAGQTLKRLEAWVEFSAEGERLNLNLASREDLIEFFRELGFEEKRALIMADSILDWRDPDDVSRFDGAEENFYLNRTKDVCQMPPNRSIKDLREVPYIRGFDSYIFWVNPGLIDLVTVYSESTQKQFRASQKTFILEEGGVYRIKVRIKREHKKYKGIFIFKIQNDKVQKLFSVVM